jgi:flagellar FliL protein
MSRNAKREAPEDAAPPKKKKGKLFLMLGLVVLLGGGGGAALYASGVLVPTNAGHDADRPQLVARSEASSSEVAEAMERARQGQVDPRVFQATYHTLADNFTSNLRGGQAFVQIGIGVSTYYDEAVIENLEKHEMAIRSAILMVLSEQDPIAIATAEGKEALRQELKNAVNRVLTNKEGFGGIDEVHFTSFVTQ